MKGIGGYHLACDATNADAVATLRASGSNEGPKPFPPMVRDLETAERVASLTEADTALLTGFAHPIVLARGREAGSWVAADEVAPGQS